ncbi:MULTISPECIES: hypothetical protein [Priestia]|uniref:hypothetical protein n=1 Tax=Priestia TaxID=2800373 RepID=UPI002040D909|nr:MULTISPECIES: hypothetical protein [Priestia]MCM3768946.1 hypothetical protein [Priestia aryabhattai]MDY0942349.1 hypothetical protein [Priestia megaterium]
MSKKLFKVSLIIPLLLACALFVPHIPGERHDHHAHAETGPCAKYGVHRMYSQGPAIVKNYKTDKVIFHGGWYKCACGQMFIASGYPHLGGPINKYVTHGGIKSIQYISGSASFMVDSTKVYSTSKSTMSGYRFLSQ